MFISPGQVVRVDNTGEPCRPKSYALVFYPDLVLCTTHGKDIQDYPFLGYHSNEAIHASEHESKIVLDCFLKVQYELKHAIDKHSKN